MAHSERVLQSHLQFPHGPGRGNHAKGGGAAGIGGRHVPVRMIGRVEGVKSELQRVTFVNAKILTH